MNQEITFQYQPNKESLVNVNKHLLFSASPFKYFPVMLLLIIAVQLLPGILYPNDNEMTAATTDNIIPILGIIPVFVLLYFIFIRAIKKGVAANTKNLERMELIFDTKGFTQHGESFTSTYNWSGIKKIKETKEWFLIYITKNSALPVFKNSMTASQLDDLKNLFKSLNVKKSLK